MFVDTITTDQMRGVSPLLDRLAEEFTILGTQVASSERSPLGALLSTVEAQLVALRAGVEHMHAAVKLAESQR